MDSEDMRRELLRRRRRAIRALQDTGMTDEEIERELGYSIQEVDEASRRCNPYFDDVGGVEDSEVAEEIVESEIVDAEIVSVDEEPASSVDDEGAPIGTAKEAVSVALVPVRRAAPRPDENDSETDPPSKWSETWWETEGLKTNYNRCQGHSTRTGLRCKQPAIKGAAVCKFHGGLAPQVQRAAKVRLDMAADRMAANLLGLAEYSGNDAIRLGATNSALDRAGIIRPTQVEVGSIERKPYEDIFDRIGGGTREESRARRGEGSLSSTAHECGSYATESDCDDPGDGYTGDGGLRGDHTGDFDRPAQDPGRSAFDREVGAEDAIRRARAANAQAGRPQLAIESPHRRYRRG